MSFGSSSSVKPTASSAASFAIGKPVAFDASAEERETRGFISITRYSPLSGMHRELDVRAAGRDADRARGRERRLAELLVDRVGERLLRRDRPRVAGVDAHRVEVLDRADDDRVAARVAHHLELVLLPALRGTPRRAPGRPGSSARPWAIAARSSSGVQATPPPVPPSVNAGRTIAGTGNSTSGECAMIERGIGMPTPCTVARKSSRSSARLIASRSAPISSTPERRQLDREVERGLAAERRQDRVGALALDHLARPSRRRAARGRSRRPTRGRS